MHNKLNGSKQKTSSTDYDKNKVENLDYTLPDDSVMLSPRFVIFHIKQLEATTKLRKQRIVIFVVLLIKYGK